MSDDEGMSRFSSDYFLPSEPDAFSSMDFDFDAYFNEGPRQTPDVASSTSAEAASLTFHTDVGVSLPALPLDILTEQQPAQLYGLGTEENSSQTRGWEHMNTIHLPASATDPVVVANFDNDMSMDDRALDLTGDDPTQMSTGTDLNRALALDWNLFWTYPALSTLPNHDPDLGVSAPFSVGDSTAFATMGMQQSSQNVSGEGLVQPSNRDLPDVMCQVIAKQYLQQCGLAGSGDLLPATARLLAQKCLNDHGYQQQAPQNSSRISSNVLEQQATQFSSHLVRSTPGYPDPSQPASSPSFAAPPPHLGLYADSIGTFPVDYDTHIAQTPIELGCRSLQFSQENMATPQIGFGGVSSGAIYNPNGLSNGTCLTPLFSSRGAISSDSTDINNAGPINTGLYHVPHVEESFAVDLPSTTSVNVDSFLVSTLPSNSSAYESAANWTKEFPNSANSVQNPPITEFSTVMEPTVNPRSLLNGCHHKSFIANRPEASSTIGPNSEAQSSMAAVAPGNSSRSKRKSSASDSGMPKDKSNEHAIRRACLNCKLKRLACGPHDSSTPCINCRKTFRKPDDFRILISICQDFDEKAVDLRKSIPDFFELGRRKLMTFVPSGSIIELELAHPLQIIGNKVIQIKNTPKLMVKLEKGRTVVCIGHVHPVETRLLKETWNLTESKNGDKELIARAKCVLIRRFSFLKNKVSCRILEETLPSHKQFVDWARFDIGVKAKLVPEDMECALDNFFDEYTQRQPDLPLNGLVSLVLETACLARFLDNRRPVLSKRSQKALERMAEATEHGAGGIGATSASSSYIRTRDLRVWQRSSRIGENIRNQLLSWIAKGFEEREARILSEFDNYMRKPEHPFILLACVQRMMLLYRRIRERYYEFAIPNRYLNNKTMTDLMARRLCFISGKCFSGNQIQSAFSDRFRQQQRDALKDDENLITKFDKLNLTERYFLQECEKNERDSTYVSLHGQMKDKRTARKDNIATTPVNPDSASTLPPLIPVVENEKEANYRMWTLLTTFGPHPPPPTVDAHSE